jgi:hypothetical protein
MNDRLRHLLDDAHRYCSVSDQIDDARDATHTSQPLFQRRPNKQLFILFSFATREARTVCPRITGLPNPLQTPPEH